MIADSQSPKKEVYQAGNKVFLVGKRAPHLQDSGTKDRTYIIGEERRQGWGTERSQIGCACHAYNQYTFAADWQRQGYNV